MVWLGFGFCYENCSDLLREKNVWEKFLNIEAEGREFSKVLRSLEQFIQTVKGENNFWSQNAFLTCSWRFLWCQKLEQLLFKIKKFIGILKSAGKVRKRFYRWKIKIYFWKNIFSFFFMKRQEKLKINLETLPLIDSIIITWLSLVHQWLIWLIWLIRLIWLIWLIWLIRLIWLLWLISTIVR